MNVCSVDEPIHAVVVFLPPEFCMCVGGGGLFVWPLWHMEVPSQGLNLSHSCNLTIAMAMLDP